jgi:hypothetical protein
MEKMFELVIAGNQNPPTREQMREIFSNFWDEWMTFAASRGINLAADDGQDGLSVQQNEYLTVKEQGCLIEAMVWGYWHRILPELLDKYLVVEVEKDEEPLSLGALVLWQAKSDALLRNKSTGMEVVFSLKTSGRFDKRKADEGNVDMQGKSELWALEQRLGRKLGGVLMHYMDKGNIQKDNQMDGRMAQYSALIRGYRLRKGKQSKEDILTGNLGKPTYFWRWEYTNDEGKKKRLHASTHEAVRFWADDSPLTIEEWIDMLARGEVQSSAKESVSYQEQRIRTAKGQILSYIEQGQYEEANSKLNEYFPMYTHSCNYPSACPFKGVCHMPMTGDMASEVNPLQEGIGKFIWREAHHEGEKEKHDAKG